MLIMRIHLKHKGVRWRKSKEFIMNLYGVSLGVGEIEIKKNVL